MIRKKLSYSFPLNTLTAITPLDGRYRKRLEDLAEFSSEYGLIKIRIEIEAKYLIALSESKIIRPLSKKEKDNLLQISEKLTIKDIEKVKEIEKETRHDVKAMERAFRSFIKNTSLKDLTEMIHFGLTSWDINDTAFTLILKRSTEEIVIPILKKIVDELIDWSERYKSTPMLARTHGQAAAPTTLGKELVIFATRLDKQIGLLKNQKLTGKLTGAVGNFNSLKLAYPHVDWIKFSEKFISSFGLTPNMITTQINPYDDFAQYFQTIERINNILIDFSQDAWRYISDGWFTQKVKKGEVGSSAMPQKVNPIDFENAEGNLGMANSMLEFMARKLPVSRLQRDLSDSTVLRNIGTALGFSLLGYLSILNGFLIIEPNLTEIENALNEDWAILTEGVQTVLRKNGVSDPYSMVASLIRGKKISSNDWNKWVGQLKISENIKKDLEKLTPKKYIGLAKELTEKAIKEISE